MPTFNTYTQNLVFSSQTSQTATIVTGFENLNVMIGDLYVSTVSGAFNQPATLTFYNNADMADSHIVFVAQMQLTSTALTSHVVIGNGTLVVNNAAGLSSLNQIKIFTDGTNPAERRRINNITGNAVHLIDNLQFNHNAGSVVASLAEFGGITLQDVSNAQNIYVKISFPTAITATLTIEITGITIGTSASANTNLSNLQSPTAINQNLLFGTTDTFTIGDAAGTARPSAVYSKLLATASFVDFTQITTPANPSSGHDRLYFKGDDDLYILNSAGVEKRINLANFFPSGASLTGTYNGEVVVIGTAVLTSNVNVQGDLFVIGNLTNTGGYSMNVEGDCIVSGNFNFTPSSTLTAQDNVTIAGDLILGSSAANTHQFKINPGQFPIMSVGGDLLFPNGPDTGGVIFDGSGVANTGATGLTLKVFGSILQNDGTGGIGGEQFLLNGADSSTGNGGAGGTLIVAGSISWLAPYSLNGGNSTFNGGNGGNGGILQVAGDGNSVNFQANGGSAGTGGRGGNGGSIIFWSDLVTDGQGSSDGGASTDSSGTAGNGGTITIYGNGVMITGGTFSSMGGSGPGTAGNGGTIECWGDLNVGGSGSLTINGGSSSGGNPGGNGGTLTCHANALITTINIAGGTGSVNGSSGTVSIGGNLITSASSLSGTIGGTLTASNITMLGNLSVGGDSNISGNLSNQVGAALTTKGDLFITGSFNFTPTLTTTTQGNVSIGGDFTFGANSEFRVNPGQSPSLTVNGSMYPYGALPSGQNQFNFWTFNGTGQTAASGLTLNIGGNVIAVGIDVSGGDATASLAAGSGGSLNCGGSAVANFTANGGNSVFDGFGGGDAGGLFLDFQYQPWSQGLSMNGGNTTSSTVGNGGVGGFIAVGEFMGGQGDNTSANGGNANAGNGGNGGHFYCQRLSGQGSIYSFNGGNSTLGNGGDAIDWHVAPIVNGGATIIARGGNGGVNGGAGAIMTPRTSEFTSSDFDGIDLRGGNGTSGNGGAGGQIIMNGHLVVGNTGINLSGGTGNGGSGTGGASGSVDASGGIVIGTGGMNLSGGTGFTNGTNGNIQSNGDVSNAGPLTFNAGNTPGQINILGRFRQKFTKTYTDLAAGSNTNTVNLIKLTQKIAVTEVIVKQSASFAGGSISAYTVSLGQSGNTTRFSAPFDVFQASADATYQSTIECVVLSFGTPDWVTLTAMSTGDTLNNATTGSVDIWLETKGLAA